MCDFVQQTKERSNKQKFDDFGKLLKLKIIHITYLFRSMIIKHKNDSKKIQYCANNALLLLVHDARKAYCLSSMTARALCVNLSRLFTIRAHRISYAFDRKRFSNWLGGDFPRLHFRCCEMAAKIG